MLHGLFKNLFFQYSLADTSTEVKKMKRLGQLLTLGWDSNGILSDR